MIITVILVVLVSALCSITEAMLYSLPMTHIEKMREDGNQAGLLLYDMRTNVDKPLSAVLTLNSLANTAGASVAGALAANALGAGNMPAFTVVFTILMLLIGEIIPKTIGLTYSKTLAGIFAYFLKFIMIVLMPVTWASSLITRWLSPKTESPEATEDDIRVMASLSRRSGTIQPYEEVAIQNILTLDKKHVEDVMTPRTVVFSLPASLTLDEAYDDKKIWHFSRIPVYEADNEDVVGQISHRDIMLGQESGRGQLCLRDIMKPIHFVLESQTLDKVLTEFLEERQHLFAVLDEYGGLAGVVSLEDVLEEMLGREIVDESDETVDMRALALQRREEAVKKIVNQNLDLAPVTSTDKDLA